MKHRSRTISSFLIAVLLSIPAAASAVEISCRGTEQDGSRWSERFELGSSGVVAWTGVNLCQSGPHPLFDEAVIERKCNITSRRISITETEYWANGLAFGACRPEKTRGKSVFVTHFMSFDRVTGKFFSERRQQKGPDFGRCNKVISRVRNGECEVKQAPATKF